MNPTLQILIQLQEVDTVILDLQSKMDEFPKMMQEFDQLLQESEQKAAQLQSSIDEQEKIRRGKELDIESGLEQIKKYQGQLLQVKTNKEYSALLAEIKSVKNKNSLHEDDVLELMESIERAKISLTKTQHELTEIKARIKKEKQRKEIEQVELQQQLDEQLKARETIVNTVEDGVLREYTRLLKLRHGMAVASVKDNGVCLGCYVALTPQMFAEVKSGEHLHRCPTCFRYLYWPETLSQEGEE